jgi:hypothetical protein
MNDTFRLFYGLMVDRDVVQLVDYLKNWDHSIRIRMAVHCLRMCTHGIRLLLFCNLYINIHSFKIVYTQVGHVFYMESPPGTGFSFNENFRKHWSDDEVWNCFNYFNCIIQNITLSRCRR